MGKFLELSDKEKKILICVFEEKKNKKIFAFFFYRRSTLRRKWSENMPRQNFKRNKRENNLKRIAKFLLYFRIRLNLISLLFQINRLIRSVNYFLLTI